MFFKRVLKWMENADIVNKIYETDVSLWHGMIFVCQIRTFHQSNDNKDLFRIILKV